MVEPVSPRPAAPTDGDASRSDVVAVPRETAPLLTTAARTESIDPGRVGTLTRQQRHRLQSMSARWRSTPVMTRAGFVHAVLAEDGVDLRAGVPRGARSQRSREHRARRRGAAARRAARSGDNGDDGPGEPPPATAALAAVAALLVFTLAIGEGRPRKPSQSQRVLSALRRAGERGIVTIDFLAPTIDGREPILRLPSRIDELRQAGHQIETVQKRPVARYVLRRDAEASREDLAAAAGDESRVDVEVEQPQLVDDDACRPPENPYDPMGEWA